MLQITGYKKVFHSEPVLQIPDLLLEENIYWLKGENGSGKTTFLKSIAGLLPFDGNVSVDNISLKKQRRPYTACVNYAMAEPNYPSFLTGLDLLKFYLQVKKGSEATVKTITAAFGMNHYLHHKVDSYSSGMTKKLSLLLAFTGRPKLILLDEPFTTLDADAVIVLQQLIKDAFRQGISFCVSSHQPVSLQYAALTVGNHTIVRP